jgi:hypothetical protein
MATYDAPEWTEVMAGLGKLEPAPGLAAALAACPPDVTPQTMTIGEVEAIWSAIDGSDDWQPLHDKIAAIRRCGAFNAALGLMTGPNGRPGHRPITPD